MTMRCACLAAFEVLALTGSPARSAEKNTAEREAQDRAQIEKLMWQYVRVLDTDNADAYAACYTPDGNSARGQTRSRGARP